MVKQPWRRKKLLAEAQPESFRAAPPVQEDGTIFATRGKLIPVSLKGSFPSGDGLIAGFAGLKRVSIYNVSVVRGKTRALKHISGQFTFFSDLPEKSIVEVCYKDDEYNTFLVFFQVKLCGKQKLVVESSKGKKAEVEVENLELLPQLTSDEYQRAAEQMLRWYGAAPEEFSIVFLYHYWRVGAE